MRQDYETEAKKLAKVVDIAIDSFTKYPPKGFTKEHLNHSINTYSKWKNSILNPEPKFRKIASLKHHIQNVFTYFQEEESDAVEYFWRQVAKENLNYVREDKLRKIINGKKIKGNIEYELVIDCLVTAEQDGRITEEEAKQLRELIDKFETQGKNK